MEFIPFGAADKIKLSVEIVKSFVAIPTKSGATCNDRDAMRFMMLCQAQRLNPFAGDAFLAGYDGKNGPQFSLITAHVAFMKRAESCPDYEGMESGVILLGESDAIVEREGDFALKSENVVGGWARVYRKNRKPTYRRLAVEQRKPNYETPFWQGAKMAEQIVKCAEADALRATFPTLLGGLHLEGDTAAINVESTIIESSPAHIAQAANLQSAGETVVTPQAQLEAIVLGAGFTFEHLRKFGADSNNIPDADSIASFSDIKADDAKRLVRAKTGLLNSLKQMAEGGQ